MKSLMSMKRISVATVALAAASTLLSPASLALAAESTTDRVQAAARCEVRSNGKLYCGNYGGAPLYATRSYDSEVRDYIETTQSVFLCWGRGDRHNGGNNVWYWTNGDMYGRWGNVPAEYVFTSVDPPAGMTKC
ncbi:hypothetical protein [Nocardiopsis tropica]|uniref:Peptidase inhibitor family I36 n=1 Tax=Nocardiopsis tropica TaxID=109330 RepID=A0ABV1ZZ56_9ACTN